MSLASLVKWATCAIVLASLQTDYVWADVILDDFSTPSPFASQSLTTAGSYTLPSSTVGGGLLAGAMLNASGSVVSTDGSTFQGITIGAGALFSNGNGVSLTADTSTNASVILNYSGFNLDLSPFSDLNLQFLGVTPGTIGVTLPLSVALSDGTSTQTASFNLSPSGPENFLIPLSNFGSVMLNQIQGITLSFNDGSPGENFQLQNFGADLTSSSAVPEPSSLLVWGLLGMVSLCFGCRNLRARVAI